MVSQPACHLGFLFRYFTDRANSPDSKIEATGANTFGEENKYYVRLIEDTRKNGVCTPKMV